MTAAVKFEARMIAWGTALAAMIRRYRVRQRQKCLARMRTRALDGRLAFFTDNQLERLVYGDSIIPITREEPKQ